MRYFWAVLSIFCFQNMVANEYLGSREGDPASLVENVSTIHGDYTEVEIDLVVPAPDPLILSRFYSSCDTLQTATFGGWRFNPHCFLYTQTSAGRFESAYAFVGTSEGSIQTYIGRQSSRLKDRSLFKIDAGEALGLANTARGNICAWTNLKNNELYFDPQTDSFELALSTGGKRFYVRCSLQDTYLLSYEILPSGNRIFYEFDGQGQLSFIKETNASEKKILAWIRLAYEDGVHIDTSDGKTLNYQFQQEGSCSPLLTEVIRSHKPNLHYQYEVIDGYALLLRKELPEGRFVEVDYYADRKVRSVTSPVGSDGIATVQFFYGQDPDGTGFTEVCDSLNHKTLYRFDEDLQLTCIEQYLDGSLYRVHKKSWGGKENAANLISTSIEDGSGCVLYYRSLVYDDGNRGNIIEEREYGNLTGTNPGPVVFDEKGMPDKKQEFHARIWSYSTTANFDVANQKDVKGNGMNLNYKKGTNILASKAILENNRVKKRWFYDYNEDGVLVRMTVDDHNDMGVNYFHNATERHITVISPKQQIPNAGAAEVIEEKYVDIKGKSEHLLKKVVNQFDSEGNIVSHDIYDSKGVYSHSVKKGYEQGLPAMETDPCGNEIHYGYDANHNLVSEYRSESDISLEYGYDLKNRLICIRESECNGNSFEIHLSYDAAGQKLSETDRFGNATLYTYDELGRVLSVSYPEVRDGLYSSSSPIYRYGYDIFDNVISITDPKGNITRKSYNVRNKPLAVYYPDGTQEVFKYDTEGSLHRYCGRDGLTKVFEYDYLGRVTHVEYNERNSQGKKEGFKRDFYWYSAFRLISKEDDRGATIYHHDQAGRISSVTEARERSVCTLYSTGGISWIKNGDQVELLYDSLSRVHAVKKWKTSDTFTLQTKEYDLLDRVLEEKTEDTKGHLLLKSRYAYDRGRLSQVIGYPQNQESVLVKYAYDGFGRLCTITDALHRETKFVYDDHYINEAGQRVIRRTQTDPSGNQTEEIFDALINVVKIQKKDGFGELLAESEFIHDSLGNRIFENNSVISSGRYLRTYSTQWLYDFGGQLQGITQAVDTAGEKTTNFSYDRYGDLIFVEPVAYRYNSLWQLQSISSGESKAVTHQLSYDRRDNLSELKIGSTHTVKYKTDTNGQLLSESVRDECGTYQVSYTYDGEGCIRAIQLPDGSFIEYTYEGPFVKSVSRLTDEKEELYNYQVVSRDQMGHLLEEVLPGSAGRRRQVWDPAGERTEIVTDLFQDRVPPGCHDLFQNIRRRETILGNKRQTTEYEYNALCQLVSEKGEVKHTYVYDSLGNRLQKDDSSYKINDLNQLFKIEDTSYTFDQNGNLSTKKVAGKVWTFCWNPLDQLVSVKDPDQNVITFTYDLSGKRLTKRMESKGRKARTFRYFYIGSTEIGCLDEKGTITELKVPGDPHQPETSCIAIELKKGTYVPLYDLQGNIVCLLDHEDGVMVESYSYSAFGEDEIIIGKGKNVSDSVIGNPWRYRGKRADKETGLIYFGHRYYDPKAGRWISADPAGDVDGPNLYVFAQNNPVTYVDYFGLATEVNENQNSAFLAYFYGEYEPNCHCEVHRKCRRGGDLSSSSGTFFKTRSGLYEAGSRDLDNLGIGFINGIDTIPSKAREHISRIEGYALGAKIQGVYNATHTAPIDVLECIAGFCGVHATPVQMLKDQWNHFIQTHGPDAKFLQICHSGGAIHVYNALASSPQSVRDRIIIVAISPGAIIPDELCFKAYNYASKRDFVPKLDVRGNLLYGDQLILLESHKDALNHDHGFDSPTFQDPLQYRITNFLN